MMCQRLVRAALGRPSRNWRCCSLQTTSLDRRQADHEEEPRQPRDSRGTVKSSFLSSLVSDISALQQLHQQLLQDQQAVATVESLVHQMIQCQKDSGIVFVTGIGKSSIVAKRLAGSLASISIRSHWVHASEWVHGELGNLSPQDRILIFSHSGATAELLQLPDLFRQRGCTVLSIVGNEESPLARQSDYCIVVPAVDRASCPVPSRSIVAQEAVINGIVEAIVGHNENCPALFRVNHPGGSLGKTCPSRR